MIDSGVVDDGRTGSMVDASRPSVIDAAQPTPVLPQDSGPMVPDDALVIQDPNVAPGTVVPAAPDASAPGVATPLPSDGMRGSVCYTDKPCGPDLFCFAPTGGSVQYPGLCTEGCRTNANCPPVDGIPQVCSTSGQCIVDCAGADDEGSGKCPVNETCRNVRISPLAANVWRCTYPDNSGARSSALFGRCSTRHGSGDCTLPNVCHVPEPQYAIPGTPETAGSGYCASECASAMDCPVSPGITAVPMCTRGRCELDCGAPGANTCPNQMNCRDIDANPLNAVYRCVFLD